MHEIISRQLGVSKAKVASVLSLIQQGCTVPFIARYRKEATGGLNEVDIDNIKNASESLNELQKRKEYITDVIKNQGKLTDELKQKIDSCFDSVILEDIYLPYKPKRRTRASIARDNGLEPLARIIMKQNSLNIRDAAERVVDGNKAPDTDAAISGASDIIAEWISESEEARNAVRYLFRHTAVISSKVIKGKEVEGEKYRDYFDFSEQLRRCSPHRYMAMRRGESEGFLKVSIDIDHTEAIDKINRIIIKRSSAEGVRQILTAAVSDSCKRLIIPSIENEFAADTKLKSDTTAIEIFTSGLRQLLMQPPLRGHRIMAIDPGYRTGCKVVCLDEYGTLITHTVIYPTKPRCDISGASTTVKHLIQKHGIQSIALGDGTASRDTFRFLRDMPLPSGIQLHVVSEQGASIYSASDMARQEFPDHDVTVRGAVSIGRRLLDPLAELVKIDPKSIGVGQYQHDVNQSLLKKSLDFTVESCVNQVGVDVNSASSRLLSYVAGIGPVLADNIVRYRTTHGAFRSRKELLKVDRLGEKAFKQCAGFIRVPESDNPLDNSAVHPESYHIAERMARDMNCNIKDIIGNTDILAKIDLHRYVTSSIGIPTLNDIISELHKPGRDPREKAEEVTFDASVQSFDDLKEGMVMIGKVVNVTAFGAFIDLGIKENGLVHLSQMSDKYIKSPLDVVSIGQQVSVRILDIDNSRRRISLTMKDL